MPTIRMTVDGGAVLRRNLARLAGRERLQAQHDGLDAGAGIVETHAKIMLSGPSPSAPGEPPGLDTGTLRGSVKVDEVTPFEAYIAPHTDYAEHLEFGTSRMAARPYMRPALDENVSEILAAIRETVAAFVESVRG